MDLSELGDVPTGPGSGLGSDLDGLPARGSELAGQVGAEVATPLSAALERVSQLATTGHISRRGLRALADEIERARHAAMTGQQIARLASGRVSLHTERVDLTRMLRDALLQRGREIEARGLEVRQSLRPAFVRTDPSLLYTLLQALLDWAFEHSCARTVAMAVDVRSAPALARMQCEFDWRPADQVDTTAATQFEVERAGGRHPLDTLAWRLVEQTAATLGLIVDRLDTPWQVRLAIELPDAAEIESLGLADAATGHATTDALALPLAQPLAGSHVLVVSPRRELRGQVRAALAPHGLMVDYVTTVDDARAFCAAGMPHALVWDGSLAAFDALRRELLVEQPMLVLVEIAEDAKALEVATGGREQEARIGRGAIAQTLPSALRYALGRAR